MHSVANASISSAFRRTALATIPEESALQIAAEAANTESPVGAPPAQAGPLKPLEGMGIVPGARTAGFAAPRTDALSALRTAIYRYYGFTPGEDNAPPAAVAAMLDVRAFELHADGFTPEKLAKIEAVARYRDACAQAAQQSVAMVPFAVMGFLSRYFGPGLTDRLGAWGGQAATGATIGTVARILAPVFNTADKADIHYGKVPDSALLHPAAREHVRRQQPGTPRALAASAAGFGTGLTACNLVAAGIQAAMAGAGVEPARAALVGDVLNAAMLLTTGAPVVAAVERKMTGAGPGTMAVLLARHDYRQWLHALDQEAPATTFAGLAQRAAKLGASALEIGRSLGASPAAVVSHAIAPGTVGELLLVAGLVTAGGQVSAAVRQSMAAQQHTPAVQELVTQVVTALATLPLYAAFPLASAAPGLALKALRDAAAGTDDATPDAALRA